MPNDDFETMLRKLAGGNKNEPQRLDEDAMSDLELVNTLRSTFDALLVKHKFKPGQVVRHKHPATANTVDAHRPAVFSRYITPFTGRDLQGNRSEDMSGFKIALEHDCVIMRLLSGKIVEFGENSRDYMPHPDFPMDATH